MFYDKFVQLCKQKGVSPSRAAIDAGISKSLVTKWKTNECKDPSPDVLRKLSQYFHVSVADLLCDEILPASFSVQSLDLSEFDLAFYGDFKELSEDDKETVRDMVRIMRERRNKKG